MNLAQWIKEDVAGKAEKETLSNINLLQGQAEKMNKLIAGILEYSKAGKTNLPVENIKLDELLNETLQLFTIKEHDCISILPGMPEIYQNRTRMTQVFQNLIGNALKHNDKAVADIKIYCIEKNDCFEFAVEDNGPGIAPEYHEKVFELFQVLHNNGNADSTGVGLSIVKTNIEESGGKIWIESMPGMGATFRFTLPKLPKPAYDIERTGTILNPNKSTALK
jgi:signal transduction histidine kinase